MTRCKGQVSGTKISLSIYLDNASAVTTVGQLDLGDGQVIDLSSNDFLKSIEPLNEKVSLSVYEIFHTFSGPGLYLVSYQEFSRNAGVLNIPNSVELQFYLESLIVIDPFLGDNTQPVFSFAPIEVASAGKAYLHNLGAYDPDGDSLSYELVTPKQSVAENVSDYSLPNDIEHYAGLDYSSANEAMNGPPTFAIDAITGDLIWDAPGSVGEYGLAIKVQEWRKIRGKWISMGFRVLDMQVTVEEINK